jgi:hypothetical protein
MACERVCFAFYWGFYLRWIFISTPKTQHATVQCNRQLSEHTRTSVFRDLSYENCSNNNRDFCPLSTPEQYLSALSSPIVFTSHVIHRGLLRLNRTALPFMIDTLSVHPHTNSKTILTYKSVLNSLVTMETNFYTVEYVIMVYSSQRH